MDANKQIRSGAIISYFAIFFSIAGGLIYTPWMVRQIGLSDYGLYALVGAFLSYFMMDFGLGSAIARFIAKYRTEGNEKRINDLLGITTRIYLIIDAVIAVALILAFFFLSSIFQKLTESEIEKFKVIYLIAGLFSIASFPFTPINGVMIAYERFIALKLFDLAQKVFIIIIMIGSLLCGYGLYMLVFVNALVGLSIAISKYIYLRKNLSIKINLHFFDKSIAKELLFYSGWIFIIGIAQSLLFTIAPTILGIFSGTEQITIFSIAMTLEAYTWTFASALNGLFLPKVTRLVSKIDNREEVTNLMIRVGRVQLIFIGLIITGIVVLGKSFIVLWMGTKFEQSYYVALYLIVPGLIIYTQEIALTLLFVVNELKYRAILFLSASLISVIIGSMLSLKFGAKGTAIGIFTALLICHIIGMNIVYRKVLHLDILRFFKYCHLQMIWPMAFAGFCCVVFQRYYPIEGWGSFIISGSLFALLYFSLMWFTSMNKEEKQLVFQIVNKVILPKKLH